MAHDAIDIREFVEEDLEAVVAFSLRAWEPRLRLD
jgi:phage baseplate assembly protein W